MTALIARSAGRIAAPLGALVIVLAGMQVVVVAMAASFAETGEFERLARLVPAALQSAIGPAVRSFGGLTTILYFDVLIVMVIVQWAVYVATEPAGDIESGIVDLLLARPVPRRAVVTRSLVLMAASTVIICLAMLAGTYTGLAIFAPPGVAWPQARELALLVAHLTLVAWAFGATGLAVAAWMRRRSAAIAVVAIGALALYLLDFIGMWWTPAERLSRVSPFFYFHGGEILTGTADIARNVAVLGAATAVAAATAYWQFARRDV